MKLAKSIGRSMCAGLRNGTKGLLTVALLAPMLANAADDQRPNIVLLVADDAGYSDFAGFGGEAQTPAMDSFADAGVKLTNFHALPNCSPSRSAFLTGADNHLNGMGSMAGQLSTPAAAVQAGAPGYQGFINDQTLMISELLDDAGYDTYMVGKWHLAEEEEFFGVSAFVRGNWPIDRGYDRSFGILDGGGDHFGACERFEGVCTRFFEDDALLTPSMHFAPGPLSGKPDEIYFSASAHTDKAMEFIAAGMAEGEERTPFFLYYADTMPHEPNQLPLEYLNSQRFLDLIAYYREKGWDGVRLDRFERMKELGLIPADMPFPPRYEGFPAWDDEGDENWGPLMAKYVTPPYDVFWSDKEGGSIDSVAELKDVMAKKMAIYTGMVEFFDSEVARLVDYLKSIGEYENTLFVYFSDNGGDTREWDYEDINDMLHRGTNNTYDNMGKAGSYLSNGPEWGQVVNTPFYGAKATVAEGGLRAAFVAAYPGSEIQPGLSSDALTTVMDVAATILDFAGVEHPVGVGATPDWDNCTGSYGERENVCPMNGSSMRDLFAGVTDSVHDREPIGFEIFGRIARGTVLDRPNRALYYEEDGVVWKLLRLGDAGWGAGLLGTMEPWKLFNLTEDPGESNDLRTVEPERFLQLIDMYYSYEREAGVIPQSALRNDDVAPGGWSNFSYTLTNDDDITETFYLDCRSDWDCVIRNDFDQVTLAPGESAEISVSVFVPRNAGGLVRTAQVEMWRDQAPEMSKNQILVTVASEQPYFDKYEMLRRLFSNGYLN